MAAMAMFVVLRDVVRRLTRRWWLLAALIALGAGLATAGTAPGTAQVRGAAHTATAELVQSPATPPVPGAPAAESLRPLELATRVCALPEVAQAAAALLASSVDPATLAERIETSVDTRVGSVLITARADDAAAAAALASAFATATSEQVLATTGTALRPIGAPVLATTPAAALPQDRTTRAGLGGLAGLLAGMALALAIPRRNAPLRDRRGLERAYGSPVLTSVPRTRGRARYTGYVALTTHPSGTVAEAYRQLRCAVLSRGRQSDGTAPRVIAVTSPGRRDGRSSVTTNLAAALAESGRRVLVIDCDFGHPTAHFSVGIHPGTGLSDLLETTDPGGHLAGSVQPSEIPGVSVLSIGTRGGRQPGALATGLPQVLAVARRMADVIVIDSEPLDCAGDAVDVLDVADAVVLVARPGRTRVADARRTADLLDRCGTRVAGVVLLGTEREREARTPYLVTRPGEDRDRPALTAAGTEARARNAWDEGRTGSPILA